MGNNQGLLDSWDLIEYITELVMTVFYEELRSKAARLENGEKLDYRFLLAVMRTQKRLATLQIVALFGGVERKLKNGAVWKANDSQQVTIRLNAKYYGPKMEITLQTRKRKFRKVTRHEMYWGSMLEIEKAVEKVEKENEEGYKKKGWWDVGNKTVDVTKIVEKLKREGFWRKDILWAIGQVFETWVFRDKLRTTGPVHVGADSTIINISWSDWWVVNVTQK
jgi:hypothetical protein